MSKKHIRTTTAPGSAGATDQEAGASASLWRREPFRFFFPLGVLLAWIGIGHWLLYAAGMTSSYSCLFHGLVQMQGFLMAFAVGFLLTAIPRRTQSAPPSVPEMTLAAGALVTVVGAAVAERWAMAELAYGTVLLLLLVFAGRRFLASAAGRRPPANFVLIPIGAVHGLAGAVLIGALWPGTPAWAMGLGRLFVEQGVFLCLAVGVGGLVLPLIAGRTPPLDLGSSPREGWKALAYGLVGAAILMSFLLEQAGHARLGPLLRAAAVAGGLGFGGGWHMPMRPGFHRRLVWLAAWLMPLGLAISGLWPDFRVPALHILFIGGFALLAFAVATHVALSHLGLTAVADGRPPAVVFLAVAFLLAMLARVAADWSQTYFIHLGWAAGAWLAGSAVWLAFLGPKLLRRPTPADD
jgi:uncharacterized protein involved in response to NO